MRYTRSDYGDFEPANIGVFGLFLIALAVAAVTSLMWIGQLRRVSAAPAWPSVKGLVIASGVHPHGKHAVTADLIVDLEYTVNGAKFEPMAQEVALDVPAAASRPSPRSSIDVWYDPADPARFTLIRDWQPRHSTRLLWILGSWAIVAVTFPILCCRMWRAMQGELIVDD